MEASGRFPEGAAVDRLDKWLSRPIFNLVLPWPAEFMLSMPGAWFGCPLYALGVSPMLLGAAASQNTKFTWAAVPLAVAAGGFWWKACSSSSKTGQGLVHVYRFHEQHRLGFPGLLLLPHAALGAVSLGGGAEAALAHYAASWFCTQLLAEALKSLAWRLRPAVAMAEELGPVPRALPELARLVRIPEQANLSFPSGDAAGGAVFAVALAAAQPRLWKHAAAVAVLCGFGRVYFHCHHLLDVAAGQLLGAGVAASLARVCGGRLGWGHVVLSQLMLLCLWGRAGRLKPSPGAKPAPEQSEG